MARLALIRVWLRRRWRRLSVAVLAVAALLVWLRCGPLPAGLLDADARPSTVIVDRHGERLYEVRSAAGTRSDTLDARALPHALVFATMAAEDVRFRSHPGVDPLALVRAAVHDLRALSIVEGGSTITQQVAKLLVARQSGGPASHGWLAKLGEAVIALRLEHRLSKDDLLALYLNLAPYGNQIEGAERASRAYFGRSAVTLTPAEAAFLAALPQQPGRYNPWRDPARARARQQHVLAVMAARGWLSAQDLAVARAERLSLNRDPLTLIAPHFVERVKVELGDRRARRIETTLDAPLQRTVHGIIAAHQDLLDLHNAGSVAIAVLDNHTGEWLAWEGSGNYFDSTNGGAIDGVIAPRQPGSALKPFTYAAAFERGVFPGRVLADVPSQFPTAEPGILYSPRNYDGQFRGPLLARAALAGSENVPAVALASEIGVPTVARLLRESGLSTLDKNASHYGLGLTLGNAEVRLDELIAAYAMLARGGETVVPTSLRTVDGVAPVRRTGTRVVSYRSAFWITDVLADAEARAYIFGRGGSLEFPFTVAAKTGTSQAYHDNWALGYTADVTVGVWTGNFNRRPLQNSTGVTGAGPLFHDVMLAAVERARGTVPIDDVTPILPVPADVHRIELCAISGLTPTAACPTRVTEWAPTGDATGVCTWHVAGDAGPITIWPEPFRAWAHTRAATSTFARLAANRPFARPMASTAAATPPPPSTDLTILQPLGGAVYLFDPTLRAAFQALALRARGGADGALRWSVDGAHVGSAAAPDIVRWPLARGPHVVTVEDMAGRSASTAIVVR